MRAGTSFVLLVAVVAGWGCLASGCTTCWCRRSAYESGTTIAYEPSETSEPASSTGSHDDDRADRDDRGDRSSSRTTDRTAVQSTPALMQWETRPFRVTPGMLEPADRGAVRSAR